MSCNRCGGILRHRIAIQKQSTSRNSVGEKVISYVDFSSSVRAGIDPIDMNELFSSDQTMTRERKRFVIRYISGVGPKQRIMFNGIPWDIESVIDEDERKRWLTILCFRVTT
jgi:SPP1 family predicted phage head-tail adaptor